LTSGRWSFVLWALLLAGLVYLQWPFLKGAYYGNTTAPASSIEWRTDFDSALVEAEQTNKAVLIDFTASWCPPCRVMKHEVWPDDAVASAVADNYIPVLLDVDDPKNAPIANRYSVDTIPTILIVDAGGDVLQRTGSISRAELVEFLGSKS
jgi:protein disulfide-isomerase